VIVIGWSLVVSDDVLSDPQAASTSAEARVAVMSSRRVMVNSFGGVALR
jgi:hypothetical protein